MGEAILENEHMIFCTLFDSNYLDRGLALVESLNAVENHFTLYIFAFDNMAYDILTKLQLRNVVVVPEKNILDDELNKIKSSRTGTEYCWTCTPVIIQYVFKNFQVESCTYIDADMFFYASPRVLLDEVSMSGCDVSIIGHRFSSLFTEKLNEEMHGKYCVEFNTFLNNENGNKVLGWWKQKCFADCSMKVSEEGFGDQKYLNEWTQLFTGVYELKNIGAGVAPWNLSAYKLVQNKERQICLSYKGKEDCQLVFFHFQGLKFLKNNQVFINAYSEPGKKDHKLINYLYYDYIDKLAGYREMLYRDFELKFMGSENRKASDRWKYTGIKNLLIYVAVFINSIVYRRRNKKTVVWRDRINEN